MKNLLFLCTFLVLPGAAAAAAGPNGEDLLNACSVSIENGSDNAASAMCGWYVRPCNCDTALPPVCLPESVSTDRLAREVISGIDTRPELKNESAAFAAAAVLSEIYPCDSKYQK